MQSFFKKKHKYHARRTEVDGIKFPSIAESKYYLKLKEKEKFGLIKIVKLQPKLTLTKAKIVFIPDFEVLNLETNETEYHEVKGHETPVYKLKKRLFKHYGQHKLVVLKKLGTRFIIKETIEAENE